MIERLYHRRESETAMPSHAGRVENRRLKPGCKMVLSQLCARLVGKTKAGLTTLLAVGYSCTCLGSEKQMRAPRVLPASTQMRPLCASTIDLARKSPNPTPLECLAALFER